MCGCEDVGIVPLEPLRPAGGQSGGVGAVAVERVRRDEPDVVRREPDDGEPVLVQGIQPGGQLTITTEVENWPGMTEVQGPDLMVQMKEHAARNQ